MRALFITACGATQVLDILSPLPVIYRIAMRAKRPQSISDDSVKLGRESVERRFRLRGRAKAGLAIYEECLDETQ